MFYMTLWSLESTDSRGCISESPSRKEPPRKATIIQFSCDVNEKSSIFDLNHINILVYLLLSYCLASYMKHKLCIWVLLLSGLDTVQNQRYIQWRLAVDPLDDGTLARMWNGLPWEYNHAFHKNRLILKNNKTHSWRINVILTSVCGICLKSWIIKWPNTFSPSLPLPPVCYPLYMPNQQR